MIAALVAGSLASSAAAAPPPDGLKFGIDSFTTEIKNQQGADETRAGAHPHSARARIEFTSYDTNVGVDRTMPVDDVRHITTRLPQGFVGNPQAAEACPAVMVGAQPPPGSPTACPPETWVGYIRVEGTINVSRPVVNLTPEPGFPAEFGFSEGGLTYTMYPQIRSESDFGVNIEVPRANVNANTLFDVRFCSWGVEATLVSPVWGWSTFRCRDRGETGAFLNPFLTNPATECPAEAPVTELEADSWGSPGTYVTADAVSPLITDCDSLSFEPSVEIAPTTTQPDAPTGLNVEMTFPQSDNSHGQAPAALKKAVVRLPEGMSINPAAADGLSACADGELMLKSKAPFRCPEAAKIGEAKAISPLLAEPIKGAVYIRSQNSMDPQSGEMYRLALVLRNKDRGIDVRLPGQVHVNPATGRVEAVFDNNPELPVSSINVQFKDGPRAPLTTPATCGPKTTDIALTSWGGQTKSLQSTFNIDCAPGLGSFSPSFQAGTVSPVAGESSPFALTVARDSGTKELKSIQSIRLPEGLLGRVASVPLCEEALAAAGACPEASRVGHVQAAVGAGNLPLWVPQAGKEPTGVYLTGPFNGAPYGLSIKVPAQAGPFDLGRVVVRSALHVDERTAAITSGVDEIRLIDPDGTVTEVLPGDLPRILKGVLLNQREIRVIVDREDFMVNPTNCSEQQITAEIRAYGGGKVDASNRFAALDCASLGFKPRFRARILDKGRRSTLRSWHPRTRFTVVPRKGDANIGGARVALPSSTILDQSNIGTTCTRAQMAAQACPAKSVVGYAKAWSPLLRKAVEGPVYLAANGGVRPLPDLAAVLDGEIRVVLQGEISTLRSGGKARLQNTFRVVPDAPVNRFVLTMRGGKNTGLLVNSTDLCRTNERGVAVFNGQNGLRQRLGLRLAPSFRGCAKVRRQATRRAAARKASVRKAAARQAQREA